MERLRTKARAGLVLMIRMADDSIGYLKAHGATKKSISEIKAGRDYAETLLRRQAQRVARRAAK